MGGEGEREGREAGKEQQIQPFLLLPLPFLHMDLPSCSAGVSRSGTFCTLDYCIGELHAQQKVNV